jgi:hypothetical protein
VSALGTLPLPSRPSLNGIGPEMHWTIPLDRKKRFALGIAGNFMHYDIPYAEWELAQGAACAQLSSVCIVDPWTVSNGAIYHLYDERSETHYTFSVAVYPSMNIGKNEDAGHVFGGFSAHTGFKNDGFTNTPQNGSTLEDSGLVTSVGAGYGIKLDVVRLSGMLALPLTSVNSPVNYGVMGFFNVGVDLELWESKEEKRREREMQTLKERAPDDDGDDE